MNLIDSPSYPSGHTTYGYMGSLVLAVLVPERYQQMIARGAEYGNDRILMGAHYAMDVLGGRTLALYDLAHLLANDPAYVGPVVAGRCSHQGLPGRAEGGARRCFERVASGMRRYDRRLRPRGHRPVQQSRARTRLSMLSTQTYGLPVVLFRERRRT